MKNIRLPKAWSGLRLTGLVGEGSYGKVYRAEDAAGQVSAVKIIPFLDSVAEPQLLHLLQASPGIVRIQDYKLEKEEGSAYHTLYIRMEYLTDFRTWTQEHLLTEDQAAEMMMDLCTALSSCEKAGVLHRDIKPENILVTGEGHCKLCDFGVSRLMEGRKREMTLQGTWRYMAPEVYHGQAYDHRADLYSLGLVFYQLMNGGRDPFTDSEKQIISSRDKERALGRRMSGDQLPLPENASKEFGAILRKACAYQPYDRYRSGEDLKKDLIRLKKGSFRRRGPAMSRWTRFKKGLLAAALALLLTGIPYRVWSLRPVVDKEVCGPGVTWTLDHRGTLTISGNGVVIPPDTAELYSHLREIKRLIVDQGVKSVGLSKILSDTRLHYELSSLRRIDLREGVKFIQKEAFAHCYALEKVKIPDSVEEIGESAFAECASLKSIALPEGVTEISDGLFAECYQLERISVSPGISAVGADSFTYTRWLEKAMEESGYAILNDILVAWSGSEEEVVIPEEWGIRMIAGRAFSDRDQLKRLHLPDTVEIIGGAAFAGCDLLNEIHIPDGVTRIEEGTFSGCDKLKRVELPDGLTSIGENAFEYCPSLKEIRVPETVTYIGANAFQGTPFLKRLMKDGYGVVNHILVAYTGAGRNVRIPEELGLYGIAGRVFARQAQITGIEIPEGVTWMGAGSFEDCRKLRHIRFPKSLVSIEDGGKGLWQTRWLEERLAESEYVIVNDILVCYGFTEPQQYDIKELSIPESLPIKRISGGLLPSDSYLEKLYLPDQITEISPHAFEGCYELKEVAVPETFSEEEIREIFKDTPWYYLRECEGDQKRN